MSSNNWGQTLLTQQAPGTAVSNTTAATSVLPGQAKFTMPAQLIQFIGTGIRLRASGRLSTAASSPGTLTFNVMFGSIVAFTSGATATLATSASNLTWRLEVDMYAASVGSGTAATMYGTCEFVSSALSATTPIYLGPASSSAAGNGFDSTVATVVDLFAQFSVANAANSIRCDDYEFILKN